MRETRRTTRVWKVTMTQKSRTCSNFTRFIAQPSIQNCLRSEAQWVIALRIKILREVAKT